MIWKKDIIHIKVYEDYKIMKSGIRKLWEGY